MRLPITLPPYSLWGIDNISFARLSKPPSQITPLLPTCLKQRHQWSEFAILGLHCSSTRPSPSQAKIHRKSFFFFIQLFSFFGGTAHVRCDISSLKRHVSMASLFVPKSLPLVLEFKLGKT